LLPNEHFVAIDWLKGRNRRSGPSRLRMPRPSVQAAPTEPATWRGEAG